MGICKYCNEEFENSNMANHSRWCTLNPKRTEYVLQLNENKLKFALSDETNKKRSKKIIELHKQGIYDLLKEKRTFKGRHHSEESKQQMSISRKKWISENRDKFNWNIRKGKSYPCEKLKVILRDQNINFIEEYSPFEERFFSIDIAFPDKMIAIEINGNQHYNKDGSLASYYQERHDFIESKGWKVYEIHFSKVYTNEIDSIITDILEKKNIITEFDYNLWIAQPRSKIENRKKEKENRNITKIKKIESLKQSILSSNIDFSKFGWVEQVSKILSISPQKVSLWMKKNMLEFYEEKCFKRKSITTS